MSVIEALFNHLVLPPKLPGQQDSNLDGLGQQLAVRLAKAAATLTDFESCPPLVKNALADLENSLLLSEKLNRGGLDQSSLLEAFASIETTPLIIHVVEQNAALFIRFDASGDAPAVIVEAFEASPMSEQVLAAKDALLCEFPGRASSIPLSTFQSTDFQKSFAEFLETASMDALGIFMAKAWKASQTVAETRDTASPAMITQLLMPFLDKVGNKIGVKKLKKRIRDDVNICNAEIPWRRHPFWLILRVCAERQLSLALGDLPGRACYKILVASCLAQFLIECPAHLRAEVTSLLHKKLCRRLAKLEQEENELRGSSSTALIYGDFFDLVRPVFKSILGAVKESNQRALANFVEKTTRRIDKLPKRAHDQDLRLSLRTSGQYLREQLRRVPQQSQGVQRNSAVVEIKDKDIRDVQAFNKKYCHLADIETDIQKDVNDFSVDAAGLDLEDTSIRLAQRIVQYCDNMKLYAGSTEHMSSFALNIFGLWAKLDQAVLRLDSLLREYRTPFLPELLDVLQLRTHQNLARLQAIQQYLQTRNGNSRRGDIFDESNVMDGYAFQRFANTDSLIRLRDLIEEECDDARDNKKAEWERKLEDYDEITARMTGLSCICIFGADGRRAEEDAMNCVRCSLDRTRRRIRIKGFEEYLPDNSGLSGMIVFELQAPRFFQAYRNATWTLVRKLACPTAVTESSPPLYLKDFAPLQQFMSNKHEVSGGVLVASHTKSSAQTHFTQLLRVRPNTEHNVIARHGPKFALYDFDAKIWISDLDKTRLTLYQHCGVFIPPSIREVISPTLVAGQGPSSYQLMANQRRVPQQASLHEFSSYQRLLLGTSQRWINILAELGASNLNFTSEPTTRFLGDLAIQAGPSKDGHKALREATLVFKDAAFCERLAEQIQSRIQSIRRNWRESHCMGLLLSLSEQLFHTTISCTFETGTETSHAYLTTKAIQLIKSVRNCTAEWILRLRMEVKTANNTRDVKALTDYAFRAALLCRRSFNEAVCSMDTEEDMRIYCAATIAVSEFFPNDFTDANLKYLAVHDIQLAHTMSDHIRIQYSSFPSALTSAVSDVLGLGDNDEGLTSFEDWEDIGNGWFASRYTKKLVRFGFSQIVQLNVIEGFLLVDGKPIGRLPNAIRESEEVKTLFGDEYLRTTPSGMAFCTHKLVGQREGCEVHFGVHHDEVIIRVTVPSRGLRTTGKVLQYVPRKVFCKDGQLDLPLKLIENRVHWLNLSDHCLEIREFSSRWRHRAKDWKIDLYKNMGTRGKDRLTYLVDPYSGLAQCIARMFDRFESIDGIVVSQPSKGHLTVELPRLELFFFVNLRFLLQEPKIQMEIDPEQDPGTFRGLASMIVLRHVKTHKRSILTPLGIPQYRPYGTHVEVKVDTSGGTYSLFEINDVLGHLTCVPEPILIYHQAYLHALTSSPIKDPLTGRTGVEEAQRILLSGAAQPSRPYDPNSMAMHRLEWIAKLAPRREFYPPELKRLQSCNFDPNKSINCQQDIFERISTDLIKKSRLLEPFYNNLDCIVEDAPPSPLRCRGEARRQHLEPCGLQSQDESTRDSVYKSRDSSENSFSAFNVGRITAIALARPLRIELWSDLRALLTQAPDDGIQSRLGGFSEATQAPKISALMEYSLFEQWGQLTDFCRGLRADEPFSLAFRLAVLAFGHTSESEFDLLQTLLAYARVDAMKVISPPIHPLFVDFGGSDSPDVYVVEPMLRQVWPEYCEPSRKAKARLNDVDAREQFQFRCEDESLRLARFFVRQWPARRPTTIGWQPGADSLIDEEEAVEAILPLWDRLHANRLLDDYIAEVQQVLDKISARSADRAPVDMEELQAPMTEPLYFASVARSSSVIPSLPKDLLQKPVLPSAKLEPTLSASDFIEKTIQPNSVLTVPSEVLDELDGIIQYFTSSPDMLRQNYGQDLAQSLVSMRKNCGTRLSCSLGLREDCQSVFDLGRHKRTVDELIQAQIHNITAAFSAGDNRFQWLQECGLWPGLDRISLLEQLRSSARNKFGRGVKAAIVHLGLLITLRQWLGRVRTAVEVGAQDKLQELLANVGHENWDPEEFPDWLLMELDSNILFRPHQVDVARQIIKPDSNSNSLLQLMMGQGKTSCIVGMAVTVLANTTQLVRLVVPKALVHTTEQVLRQRLGGLVGTSFKHIPYNRRTPTSSEMLHLYGSLHSETRQNCGFLLTTVDHILSFKLSGQQRLLDGNMDEARIMIRLQEQLTKGCRDIIDESDLSLGVKTQLIYPSGAQLAVDGAPFRWEVAEDLLLSLEGHLPSIQRKFPRGLEVHRLQSGSSHGFPMVHFLQLEAEAELIDLITEDICCGRFRFLRPADKAQETSELRRGHIRRLLTEPDFDQVMKLKEDIKDAANMFADKETAQSILLLLRGLLLSKILIVCLKKRWNVTYGLNPTREPIAVPYEARGVPSQQAEFGHPDVSILLTIMSFLYGGLALPQFTYTLESVLHKSDDAAAEYDALIGCANLPQHLRHFDVINVDDQGQVEELYSYLRFDHSVIMKYLNTFVFPLHAKSFEFKLSASSWDVCLFPQSAASARTTGFSGTNDNKALLPMVIRQNDLPALKHTNAETMSYLLRPVNRKYQSLSDGGKRLSEYQLLQRLSTQHIRVLLDAGAFILELSNEELARAWLEADRDAKAVVYFQIDGRAWVWYRSGKNLPLTATPWIWEITEDLLVFFDEAHCRGVDLQLHSNAKAALTLAPGLSKDSIVQAAMRLRALAKSQSVVFMAPPEVDASLRDICGLSPVSRIDSGHVLKWALEQSARVSEQLVNLHFAQGTDYCKRMDAQWHFNKFLTDDTHRANLVYAIKSKERQSIEKAYGPTTDVIKMPKRSLHHPALQEFITRIEHQREAIGDVLGGQAIRGSALEEVEQEREVEFQVEEVRVVAKPVLYDALKFTRLHAVLDKFVRTGHLDLPQDDTGGHIQSGGGSGVMRLFDSLKNTAIGQKFGVQGTASRLFCSTEFSRTVAKKQSRLADNFLRPVEWVLWSQSEETAVVVIPEEAELIIRMIRRRGKASLVHILTYAAPVTKAMAHFNNLKYYVMPALPQGFEFPMWLTTELGLFTGRLYFPFAECAMVESYLRHPSDSSDEEQVSKPARCTFTRTPIPFLLEYLALRRQVQDFQQTPMGYMLQGRKLFEDHAFFVDRVHDIAREALESPQTGTSSSNEQSLDDDTSDEDDDDWDCVDEVDADDCRKSIVHDDDDLDDDESDSESLCSS